jgi:hypothetical protein
VIPTLLLVGVVVGRWWVVPASALVWVALLLATGTVDSGGVLAAAGLAAANAVVGVLVHKAGTQVISAGRAMRARPR